MKRKKNQKVWDALTQKQSDYIIQAGWFEGTKYKKDIPVGGIAAVQNYGAVINQNVTEKQRAFLHYIGIHLKSDTNNLNIVIPPTHFWEQCKNENKEKWRKLCHQLWQQVNLGNLKPEEAMEALGGAIEGDIAAAVKAVDGPPLKPSTIQRKLSTYSDQETEGNLGKRLSGTGLMFDSVSHKVEKK